MAENLVPVDELDESAQTTALTDFANFYITLWRRNNLELITQYDQQHGYIQDINRELATNRSFTPERERDTSIQFSKNDYIRLLDEIGVKFHSTGNPETDWSTWYDQHFAALSKS
ncbi:MULTISPECIES: hypothetical protein [Furfurilactobacillus]|nr:MULTISPECIES: hypothetical protein [Furfurilactobacillus]MCF6164539.1 hypothetical protein [Furfurilactobacillus rossiae]MYV05582.1 hypothetical protein [Furfurilactobacillus milii]QFR66629.1 hypothetical protein LR814_05780 [Furfurilactobacillus rossiae]QLE62103.1 hypothetical protein LROSRS0_2058 [Furfurilactobacillus rossiae]QLE64822.1 hypothetical protein LROSL1_2021 [Furfurilactobacillus rossiae]